jgi:hypothetical protein
MQKQNWQSIMQNLTNSNHETAKQISKDESESEPTAIALPSAAQPFQLSQLPESSKATFRISETQYRNPN